MKILIELQYLPPIPSLSMMLAYPEIILEQAEHYQKRTYRNRCHIAGANGLLRLSIPLQKGKNQQQNIRAVRIAYSEPWQAEHWQSIRSAYGNAPFFEYYAPFLEPLYQQRFEFLFDFNMALLEQVLMMLQVQPVIQLSTNFEKKPAAGIIDARNRVRPKGIAVLPDGTYEAVHYPQVFSEKTGFIPNLSILDLLFCTGPQAVLILELAYSSNLKIN